MIYRSSLGFFVVIVGMRIGFEECFGVILVVWFYFCLVVLNR